MKKLNVTIKSGFHSSEARNRNLKKGIENREKNESLKMPTASETLLLLKTLEKRQQTSIVQYPENFENNSKISAVQELVLQKRKLEKQSNELSRIKVQLEESESKYFSLYNSANSAYFTLNKAGLILELNYSGSAILGSEKEKIRNRSFIQYVSPVSREKFSLFLTNVFETRRKQCCELQLEPADSRLLNVQIEGIAQPDRQNCILTLVEISGDSGGDELTRLSNERFRSVIENVQDVYYETELDGTILEVSFSVETISGGQYKRKDLIGKSLYSIYYNASDRERLGDIIKEKGSVTDYDIDFRNRDGSRIACSLSAKIAFSPLNGSAKIVGTVRDIRTRKTNENAIARHNRDLSFIHNFSLKLSRLKASESVEDILIQQIKEYTGATLISFSEYNPIRKSLLTTKIDSEKKIFKHLMKIAGKGILNLESPVDEIAYQQFFSQMIISSNSFSEVSFGAIPEAISITFKAITHIDRIFGITLAIGNDLIGAMLLCFRSGMTTPSEEMLLAFAQVAAVALRSKKAEDNLKASNELLEKKVQERTLELEKLSRLNKAILEDYASCLDDEGQRMLHIISNTAIRMDLLIDSLLSFSKLNIMEIRISYIKMQSMVNTVFDELMLETNRENIEFKLKNIPDAYSDEILIKQVWVNLLNNAVKYSSKKPLSVIEIGCNKSGNDNVYYVKDNGAGFDMAYADKLFGVFQRLRPSREFDGSGLGLANVQRILHRLGGRIWAEAVVNEGATFFFTLLQKNNAIE